jgi:hypothetical protein
LGETLVEVPADRKVAEVGREGWLGVLGAHCLIFEFFYKCKTVLL